MYSLSADLKISPAWACVMDMNHAYGTPEVHNRVDWSKTATPGCVYGDEIAGAFLSGLAMGMPGGSGGPLDREVSQIFLLTPSERWMKGGDLASSSLGVDGFIRARETAEYWLGVAALGFYLNYGTPCEIVEGSLVEVPRHVRCMTKRLAEMFDRTIVNFVVIGEDGCQAAQGRARATPNAIETRLIPHLRLAAAPPPRTITRRCPAQYLKSRTA